MIIKKGFLKIIVNKPNVTIMTATINGNHAICLRSINPSANATTVNVTKIAVAFINVVNSETIKNDTIGPNSMNKLRKSFLSIGGNSEVSYMKLIWFVYNEPLNPLPIMIPSVFFFTQEYC